MSVAATGPMRFCLDGVGVFIRGERAAEFADALARSIDPEASVAAREHAAVTVRDLLALLRGAEVGRAHGTQAMRAFPDCTEAA